MTTSVANPFTSFSFYNRKRRHREGNGFTHSHTALSGRAGVWMQAEVTVSHTVLPISSEAPAPPLGSSRSPFFGCKSGGPESEVTYPLSRSRRGLRSDSIPGLFTPLLPQTPPRNTPASELGGGNVHTLAMGRRRVPCCRRWGCHGNRGTPGQPGAPGECRARPPVTGADLTCASASEPSTATTSPASPRAPSAT